MKIAPTLAAALLLASLPHRADAQFGALMRKAKEKAAQTAADRARVVDTTRSHAPGRGTAAAPPARSATSATSSHPSTSYVVTLDGDLLDRMVRAAATERSQAARRAPRSAQAIRDAQPKVDRSNDPMTVYEHCSKKYPPHTDDKTIEKGCGSVWDAQQRQSDLDRQRMAEASRADSARYGVSASLTPDSAGAVIAGLTRTQYGIVKERITAYLVLSAGGPKAACMKGQQYQYVFTDAESAALAARRRELAKSFLEPGQVRDATWGKCRRA